MSDVCTLCLHEHTPGMFCGHTVDHGRCLCTGPTGMVSIKIPEDVWHFFSETSHGRGEQAIATTLRAVMGLFS
jgi:hypothetical protein